MDFTQLQLFPEESITGIVIEAGKKSIEVMFNLNGQEQIWKVGYNKKASLGDEVTVYPSQLTKRVATYIA